MTIIYQRLYIYEHYIYKTFQTIFTKQPFKIQIIYFESFILFEVRVKINDNNVNNNTYESILIKDIIKINYLF